ncbi:MAG: transporter [Phycisphaeraceae bacterium]|nr:MAG: transporter [Phycisphaeraceae bacterium]
MIHRSPLPVAATLHVLLLVLAADVAAAQPGHSPGELRPLGPEPHAYTTERGRFQIELSPLSWAYDRQRSGGENRRVDTFDAPFFFKYGLTDHLDIQIGGEFFVFERDHNRATGDTDRNSGFGDLSLRAKYNLWGNDGEGDTAMAVMPFATFPTGSSDIRQRGVRGGVMLPFEYEYANGRTIEFTPSFAGVRNSDDDGYVFEYANLLTLTFEVTDGVTPFIEFESSVTTESGDPWVGLVGGGIEFVVNDNMVVGPAIHFGVTRGADDVAVSLTLVVRF